MKTGRDASPSDLFAGGGPGLGDKNWHTECFDVEVPVADQIYGYLKVPYSGFVKRVVGRRRKPGAGAGAGGATTFEILLNGTTIQSSVCSIANGDAATVESSAGVLNVAHARYDADEAAIAIQSGDLLQMQIKSIEDGGDNTGEGITALMTILR